VRENISPTINIVPSERERDLSTDTKINSDIGAASAIKLRVKFR